MKMKKEHYLILRDGIVQEFKRQRGERSTKEFIEREKALSVGKTDLSVVQRLMGCATFNVNGELLLDWQLSRILYTYIDDRHINTALKRVIKEIMEEKI